LHDDGDSPVGWSGRILLVKRLLIGESSHLGELIGAHPVLLHDAAGGVCAIAREVPVGICVASKGLRIGMPFENDAIWQLAQFMSKRR
jgi:hypothetical protein